LTSLDLTNCSSLTILSCNGNKLTNLILPKNAGNLTFLDLKNNSFHQDLSFLEKAVNLRELCLGNNKFYGSLEYLKEMRKLEELNISDTDIDSGLEYLSGNIEKFNCSVNKRENAKVKVINKQEIGKFKGIKE